MQFRHTIIELFRLEVEIVFVRRGFLPISQTVNQTAAGPGS